MNTRSIHDYSRPPPLTIWDLLQWMLFVGVFCAVGRASMRNDLSGFPAFIAISSVDLFVILGYYQIIRWSDMAAQARAGNRVVSLGYSKDFIQLRTTIYLVVFFVSIPFHLLLLGVAIGMFALNPLVVDVAVVTHGGLLLLTLSYWRVSRRFGADFCDNGMMIQGAVFRSWDELASFRYNEVRRRLVIYEKSHTRFQHHDFSVPKEVSEGAVSLVGMNIERAN